jgi:class 3 adenylate cyclase/tetratricopeptide (TPR) repeat protein
MPACVNCGAENSAGVKFCGECGAALTTVCPACSTPNEPGRKFCGECGAALTKQDASGRDVPRTVEAPVAERRLVSVLFADLVGFTAVSESRDPEDVRELLSRYFDTCRRLIEIYGGIVEKFIGDAVMAVWGTPTATEDDAERAVRAALDLVAAVSALGQEAGVEGLRARAGVLTGEAAVTLGAESQGMVAGDLVNTAARVQSVAEPGSVFVGESTRRATEQTLVYQEAGTFELKGKEGLTPLWRAQRVVSGLRGSLKSHGLEAPFVGRDRELRQVKDLFHASAEDGKAQLLSITGIAGIGKSRLAWEFYKYFDGIAETIFWHRGRCLPYGEGVTYWALADMVRMRCRIAEDEDPTAGLTKLRAVLDEHVLDSEEHAFMEPRLAHLLGYGEDAAHEKHDLFAAWRLFFERLTATHPTVLAFEDLQWADESLLDFIEYLLDWSRDHPLFVVTLARPELLERRPNWGAGRRNFTSMFLEPLSGEAMIELLAGLVPGLPEELRDRILDRAEGVPLYAVETVRMLLDRGLLAQEGAAYRPTGAIDALEVPETLHALIAARLDGLSVEERRLLQDAAVLGKTFAQDALAALSGSRDEALLGSLLRKEILGVQADPRSPERGQYGFLQDLVRHVAYETLSRRERRDRHLAAAEYLESTYSADEAEVIEVVASHYVDACEAVPDAADADEIKAKARETLVRAGWHARSLAAAVEARRYFEKAAVLADEPLERASLLFEAGEMAGYAADVDEVWRHMEEAVALYEAEGDTHAAAGVTVKLGRFMIMGSRRDEVLPLLERAFEVVAEDEPDEAQAELAAQLSGFYFFSGDRERAEELADLALDIAEAGGYIEPLVHALMRKSFLPETHGRPHESLALREHALKLAQEHNLLDQAARLGVQLSDRCFARDRYLDALDYLEQALASARKLGNRHSEWAVLAEMTYPFFMLGRWDEVMRTCDELTPEQVESGALLLSVVQTGVEVSVQRGNLDEARRLLDLFPWLETSSELQAQGTFHTATASLRRAEGRLPDALAAAMASVELGETLGLNFQDVKHSLVDAVEIEVALGEAQKAEGLLALIDDLPPGRSPFLTVQARRLRARAASDAAGLEDAARQFRELGLTFYLAVTLLELAELTGDVEPRTEAQAIFEHLRAQPWVDRAAARATGAISA